MKKIKGEVFTTTVLVIAVIAAFLLGSVNNPIKSILGIGGNGQKTKQTLITKTESKPIIVTSVDGKHYVLQATTTETSTLDTNEEVKLTLWQKLLALPRLWLILMILGIFFPPITAIMGFINRKLFGEVKKIVGGVEDSLNNLNTTPEAKQVVLNTLSKKYDVSTKLLVSKVKNKMLI